MANILTSSARPAAPAPTGRAALAALAAGLLDRGHAAHRRQDRGLPRASCPPAPGSMSPISTAPTFADMLAHRPPPRGRGLHGDAALPRPRHRRRGRARAPHRPPTPTSACARRWSSPAASTARAARSPSRCSCSRPASSTPRGFTRLHVAGHPEGNRDIDPDGGEADAMAALAPEDRLPARDTDAAMAIATQFGFEAEPVIAWADRLRAARHHPADPYRRRRPRQAADA